MKKGDYFIDVSAYQAADLRATCQATGTSNTIIKVSEGTGWLSPVKQSQADTSTPVGYYHFARFGGSVGQAQAEANFFIGNLPNKKVAYLVCDYEDSASNNVQANTDAVLAFMDVCKAHGYQPIYYSYKPYTLANIDYKAIIAKYPNSLWIAAYANYNVMPTVDVSTASWFPALDGIRWWQFTSTALAGGLDKNIVLLNDDATTEETKKELNYTEEEDMFTISAQGRGIALMTGGRFYALLDANDPKIFWGAGVKHFQVSQKTFDNFQGAAEKSSLDDATVEKLVKEFKK